MKHFDQNKTLCFWEVCGDEEKVVFFVMVMMFCGFFTSFCFLIEYIFILRRGSIPWMTINSSMLTYDKNNFRDHLGKWEHFRPG